MPQLHKDLMAEAEAVEVDCLNINGRQAKGTSNGRQAKGTSNNNNRTFVATKGFRTAVAVRQISDPKHNDSAAVEEHNNIVATITNNAHKIDSHLLVANSR